MFIFYYVIDGRQYFTAARGAIPSRMSPIWESPSASVWLIPGTQQED